MTRWNRRLLLGAIAVLVPALAGCEAGLNAPTLQFHPASNGTTVTRDGITFDNAFVLGSALGSTLPAGGQAGAFMALESANGDRLVSVSAPGTADSVKLTGGPVSLPAGALVDMSGPAPKVVLTGLVNPLGGGQTVKLTFNFAQAGAITLSVPVEPAAYQYATYSPPPIPTPSASASASKHPFIPATASPSAPGTATASPSASPSPSPSTTP